MQRSRLCLVLAGALLALGGCRHMVPAPYARGQGPGSDELLGHTGAQLTALQVSKAKVIANRTLRGNLAFIAEAPGRFRGSVDVAGNELVTLAFHEQGYALRYKMEAFPAGFYEGPPSACAVEALLGISFDTSGLVDLVLGGAPVIEAPHEVLDQQWNKRGGYESLTIANDRFVQELRFGWVAGQWRVMGGQLWERVGADKGRRLWTVEHIELELEQGVYLPTKTKVSTPGKRRDDTVVINYKERNADPAFAKRRTSSGDGGDGGDGGDDGDPWEGGDDGWEDEGEWEDEGGWEDDAPADGAPADGASGGSPAEGVPAEGAPAEGAPAESEGEGAPADGDPPSEPKPGPAPKPKATEPKPKPKPEPKPEPVGPPPVPPEFQLEPSGLTERGDLCR